MMRVVNIWLIWEGRGGEGRGGGGEGRGGEGRGGEGRGGRGGSEEGMNGRRERDVETEGDRRHASI